MLLILRCSLGLLLFASLSFALLGCCCFLVKAVLAGGFFNTLAGGGAGFFFTGGFALLFFSSCFLGAQSELEFVLETRVRTTFFWPPVCLGAGSWELSESDELESLPDEDDELSLLLLELESSVVLA